MEKKLLKIQFFIILFYSNLLFISNSAYIYGNPKTSSTNYFYHDSSSHIYSCSKCHDKIYKQWKSNRHANSSKNPLFLNMYNGTHAVGFKGWAPGYKIDFPTAEGNCASCHAPGSAIYNPLNTEMTLLDRKKDANVNCIFCHNTKAISLDSEGKKPGIHSIQLSSQFLNSSVDSNITCLNEQFSQKSSLLKKSILCAPCHNARFRDTPIYETYTEWSNSEYAKQGVECQACHMSKNISNINARAFNTLPTNNKISVSHNLWGPNDDKFLFSSAKVEMDANVSSDFITVCTKVTNVGAGHFLPTGSPLRNLILLVSAGDLSGKSLPYLGSEKVPTFGGIKKSSGNYAGMPGKGFAKVLQLVPHSAYCSPSNKINRGQIGRSIDNNLLYPDYLPQPQWRNTIILKDNRIGPLATDSSFYKFQVPLNSKYLKVTSTLIYRRAFLPLAQAKGWDLKDKIISKIEKNYYIENKRDIIVKDIITGNANW
jgi:hypothetical protein